MKRGIGEKRRKRKRDRKTGRNVDKAQTRNIRNKTKQQKKKQYKGEIERGQCTQNAVDKQRRQQT